MTYGRVLPFPGHPRGFEVHGVRATPKAPCVKCGAKALPDSELCFAHASEEDRAIHYTPFEEDAILIVGDVDGRRAA